MSFAEARFTVRAVNKTQKVFSQIQNSVDKMDRRFGKLGKAVSGRLVPALGAVFAGREIIDTITKFEKLEASLKTVTGSAEKAGAAFGFVQEFASTTPFQLEEVVGAFIKLKALGLTPSEAALRSYGNTASAMGKSLNQMIEAVADASTGEFERLKEFGIKARSQGNQVTFTFQGVSKTVGKNAEEIEAYLRSIGEVQFAGAMDEQAKTLNVALSNMKDAFSKLVKAIGDAGLTKFLMHLANGVKYLADTVTKYVKPFKLGFMKMIAEVMKFGNLFIAVFDGVGDAFSAFADNISGKFAALGKDLAAFIEDPLGGISFENTKKALETGLVEQIAEAFDKSLEEAQKINEKIDAKIEEAADKLVNERKKPVKLFDDIKKKSKETVQSVNKDFESLGKSLEKNLADSLNIMSDDFGNFKDLAKSVLSEINRIFISQSLQEIGLTGKDGAIGKFFGGLGKNSQGGFGGLFSSIGDLFGGFFANGGTLRPGQWGIAGERGPEPIFAGNMPLNVIPNSRMGGKNITVNMNIQTQDAGSFRKSHGQIASEMAAAVRRAERNL
nr:hypothetical protein 5 [bacterium]